MIFRERETRSSKQVRLSVDRPDACPWLSSTAEVGVIYIQRGKSEPRRFPRPPSNRVGRGIRQELTGARSRCSSQPRDAPSAAACGAHHHRLSTRACVRASPGQQQGERRNTGLGQPASQPASQLQPASQEWQHTNEMLELSPSTNQGHDNSLTAENQHK